MTALFKKKATIVYSPSEETDSLTDEAVDNQQNKNDQTTDFSHYTTASAHLLDELRWLNRLIAAHVLSLRRVNFYEGVKDFKSFFIADEEIDALLKAGIFESEQNQYSEKVAKSITRLKIQAQSLRKEIASRVQKSREHGIFLPFVQLGNCFQLTDFEMQALVICLAPQFDSRYEKLYAYLQNDLSKKHPSVDLILNLLFDTIEEKFTVRDYFSPQAPLFEYRLLERNQNGLEQETPLLSRHLKVNDRIVAYLLESKFIDNRLESVAELFYAPQDLSALILSETVKSNLTKFIQWYQAEPTQNRPGIIFAFFGATGAGKHETAGALVRAIGLPLLKIDLAAIFNSELPFKQTLKLAFRESLLLPAALYFKNADVIFDLTEKAHPQKSQFLKILNQFSWFTFISSRQAPMLQGNFAHHRLIEVEFPLPDFSLRQQLWHLHLNDQNSLSGEVELDALAGKFKLTSGQIRDAVATATNCALWRNPEYAQITTPDLYEGCRAHSNQQLKTLAQKIKPKYTWQDIVLPKDQMAQLREITNYVKYKHVVYDDWGFDRKLSLGKGLNVLFSGPSGTGKTMAAEIMANELNLELYKIDLSTVVSKYIGETEKNLSKIFQEAETSNAILFFDEADALFGKRSEVKDAHDRYANIEIGYLLQKMDEYTGVVILATNMKKNMDEAFVRRMHFMVEFPFPEENYRLRIWQQIFPAETPLARNIDFNFLARKFKISGGNIKNIALAAAFYAADNGQVVKMDHLILGMKREFQKMGKLCVKADFGEFYSLTQ